MNTIFRHADQSNLASVLQSQGNFEAVEEMDRRALEGKEKVLGRHPFHADERQQPGVGATQSVKAQSGRRNNESTRAGGSPCRRSWPSRNTHVGNNRSPSRWPVWMCGRTGCVKGPLPATPWPPGPAHLRRTSRHSYVSPHQRHQDRQNPLTAQTHHRSPCLTARTPEARERPAQGRVKGMARMCPARPTTRSTSTKLWAWDGKKIKVRINVNVKRGIRRNPPSRWSRRWLSWSVLALAKAWCGGW